MFRLYTLSLMTALAGLSTISADGKSSMTYGYCGQPAQSFGVPWTEYTALVEFPEGFTEKFDGAFIKVVQIASPDNFLDSSVNNFIDFNLSFYKEKGGDPFYVQPCQFGTKSFTWYDFPLDTPMQIKKDEPFFVGYSGVAPTIDDACFAVDFNFNYDNYGLWLGWDDEFEGVYKWESFTPDYGNLCLRLIIEGDNLPTDEMTVNDVYAPGFVNTGDTFSAAVSVTNTASNDINNFKFIYKTREAYDSIKVDINPPLVYAETREIDIPGLVCDTIGTRVALDYKIADINGNTSCAINDLSEHDLFILSLPEGVGYDRNVLVEEGTGTWCGWCPMGIVGMEKMYEEYPDGTFIPVAIHHDDPMQSETYNAIDTTYFSAFPSVIVNRDTYRFGVIMEPGYEMLKAAYLFSRTIPAIARIDLTASFADADNKSINVSTNSEFAITTNDTHHLEYAITQDGVGPYPQTNYFAGGGDGPMGGFENLPEITMWTYDDVARTLYKGDDIDNTPGKSHQVSATFDLSDLKSTDNLRIVAMIVNNENGIVENAAMGTINLFTSVDAVEANSCCIAAKGAVKVAGLTTPAEVYASDGSLRGIIHGDGELSVTPGIYIVKAGARTWKVIVK